MLFHTVEFLFFFLPATILGYYLLGRTGVGPAFSWRAFCSLFFYGWNSRRRPVLYVDVGDHQKARNLRPAHTEVVARPGELR